MWQKTWPVLKGYSVPLFQSSLRQGKLPNAWKIAKILLLKKPNRGNYALPGTYRPISLLLTLSKAMEYLIAQKIAHLSDAYSLLPEKSLWWFEMQEYIGRSGSKKIYQAWRDKKVLSFIIFNVQGAFNGVAKDVLFQRTKEASRPGNFCDLDRRLLLASSSGNLDKR